jgi:hypothetical protein
MTLFLWMWYLLAWAAVILKRAYKSAKNPYTPWSGIAEYFKLWGPGIFFNLVCSTALFVTVWRDTTFLTKMLLMFGMHKDIQIPLNPVTAVAFGISSDQVGDTFIWIVTWIGAKVKSLLGTAPDPPPPAGPPGPVAVPPQQP